MSARLAARLDAAATSVEGQIGPRSARETTYGTHFEGYYAQLWSHNIRTANEDASLLASRLRDVATGVRDLEKDARAEQERINTAREWKRQRDARPHLEIPAVQAIGNPPTSGYSNDPVNTATGSFVENEEDLRCEGGTSLLGWARSYSSLSTKTGGHGPGWASFDGCGLSFGAEGATWTLLDGREVVFPRLGEGFDRAEHESYWLAEGDDGCGSGYVVTNSTGARWGFTASGRPTSFTLTDGATIVFDYDGQRLERIRHVRGREITLEWDGDLIAAVQADDGRRVEYRYEQGRLVEALGPLGSRRYEWDEAGLLSAVIDADGVVEVRNTYDERGRVATQASPFGRLTRFAYLPGRVTAVSDVDGQRSNTWVADARGRLLSVTDSDGSRTSMAYDRWGNQVMAKDAQGGLTVRFGYDEHGDLVSFSDAEGNVTRVVRDASGRALEVIRPSGATTRFAYDAAGLLTRRVEPDGGQWGYEYTTGGRLAAMVSPLGARTTLEYGEHGEVSAVIDPLGRRDEQEHDDLGNVSRVRLPDGAVWELGYDAMSRLRQTVDPSGGVWTRCYDRLGRLREMVDPTGVRSVQRHDDARRAVTTGDAYAETTVRMDRWGRQVATVLPDGSEAQVRYDRAGRVVELVDAVGGRTRVERDLAGRPVRIRRPGGSSVRYDYDACGRVAGVRNEMGFRTELGYDADSQLVSETWPTQERGWRRYDACGRLTAQHVPGAGTTRWVYDKAGRVVEVRDPLSGVRRFRYDQADQLVAATGGAGGTTYYEYDDNGRAVRLTDPMGGVVERTFDAMGRCTSQTDQLGHTSRARYDAAGRLVASVDADGRVVEIGYDEAGLDCSLSADGRVVSRTSRDARARTCTIEDLCDPSRPVTHTLAFDPRGLLVAHERETGWDGGSGSDGGSAGGGAAAARLGEARHEWSFTDGFVSRHTVSGGGQQSESLMEYSEDGLLTSVTTDGARTEYRYDASAQMVEARGPEGLSTWTYDEGGRLTREQVGGALWERTYSAAGQVLSATGWKDGGEGRRKGSEKGGEWDGEKSTVLYTYDRSGRRIREERSDGSRRELEWTALWSLSGVSDFGAGDGRGQLGASGACGNPGSGQVVRTTMVVDALGQLARVNDEELFFDDVSGQLIQAGEDAVVHAGPLTASAAGGWLEPSWRPGRQTRASNPYLPPAVQAVVGEDLGVGLGAGGGVRVAGLELLGERFLDPVSRSFLSPDPLEPVSGAGWAGSPYAYAGNNPVNLYDPTGLRPITTDELDSYRKANSPKWGTAVAVGVGLAFVPGTQGIAAGLIAGAVLGGGASIADQLCSGYPIDWGKVGMDTALGVAGSGVGIGIGKGIRAAAGTSAGKRAIGWAMRKAESTPVVRSIARRMGPNSKPSNPDYVNLASPSRTRHILDGDGPGTRSGGHRWPGNPDGNKTPFPRTWSDEKIMNVVSDVATDPDAKWIQDKGPVGSMVTNNGDPAEFVARATREGVPIKVVTRADKEGIVTGFPTKATDIPTKLEMISLNGLAATTSLRRGE